MVLISNGKFSIILFVIKLKHLFKRLRLVDNLVIKYTKLKAYLCFLISYCYFNILNKFFNWMHKAI